MGFALNSSQIKPTTRLDLPKMKVFQDDQTNATQKLKFVLERMENIVGKGENAGYQHSPFPAMFSKLSVSGLLKVWILW